MWLCFLNLHVITNSFNVLRTLNLHRSYCKVFLKVYDSGDNEKVLGIQAALMAQCYKPWGTAVLSAFSVRLKLSKIQALSWTNLSCQDNYVLVSELIRGAQGIVSCDWSNLESIGNEALTSLVCGKRGHIVQNERNTALPLSPRQPEHQEEQSTKFLWSQWH